MFFCLCTDTLLDLNQTKPQLLIKNVKLFAHTEKTYYLCIVKRKKEGKLPETFLNDIKNKNCLG